MTEPGRSRIVVRTRHRLAATSVAFGLRCLTVGASERIASLAIAIAANTAEFSVANGLLLKGAPGVK
jgi:hypothetical protein